MTQEATKQLRKLQSKMIASNVSVACRIIGQNYMAGVKNGKA
jgi:hypothetical protein